MATSRSSLPLRLRQLLSGEGAISPSLKLTSETPPKVKAFVDKVIKSPLHDIEIPLSGFRWEYSKGNFHHWRPLFMHFDTYFKTYVSCREDLQLSDYISDDKSAFPKNSVLQILRVMQIILENCPNKSSFGSLEHFQLLLASTDPDIVLATLETLSALVKINPSKLNVSGKLIGCGSLNSSLLTLAQGWGSKEEGLGLFSCVMANEKSQEEGLCLFPSNSGNEADKSQCRLGSTLHFEFHRAAQSSSEMNGSSNVCVIHVPDLNVKGEDDLSILKHCIDQYAVPSEQRFSLLTRIRYARAFCSSTCRIYTRICLLAFIVLVQSSDAHDELASFFANEPEYTTELISLIRSEHAVPGSIRTLAMLTLVAQLAAYSSSHERARVLSGSTIISAGGNRMLLLDVLQKAVSSLSNARDPTSLSFIDALLQFHLLHVISSSSSGSSLRGSTMVPTLLPLLQDNDSTHTYLICSAVKTLQKLMDYSNAAVSLFKDLGGIELLTQRLQFEVRRIIDMDCENSNLMVVGDTVECDDDVFFCHKQLIKTLLKALGSATYAPANPARTPNSLDSSLPSSLSLIFHNVKRFGGDVYFSAVTLMSDIIHKDPTCFTTLHDLGLTDAFLCSVTDGILPSSKALTSIPNGIGAICLNAKGLDAVKERDVLRFLVDAFTSRKYLVAMNEAAVPLANSVEELLRHVLSLRIIGIEIIIEIIEKLSSIDDDACAGSLDKIEGSNAMETDSNDKAETSQAPVAVANYSNVDGTNDERFFQLCIFHVMKLVHRVIENTETCRLFVEKKGIDALMKLLLRSSVAQSPEGMTIALHSTGVFKGFTQHHSAPLAQAFCSSLRVHLKKALGIFSSASDSLLISPSSPPEGEAFSPLFVVEFILFLAASKDNRWMNALLSEFSNGSKGVLEDIGRVHQEVLWQLSLIDGLKRDVEDDGSSFTCSESQRLDLNMNETDEQRFNSFRQFLDPLMRRRVSGWSVESQFFDLINLYRELGRVTGIQQRLGMDVSSNQRLGSNNRLNQSNPADASEGTGERQSSYYSSWSDMLRSLSFHISHLCLELGKAMLIPSRRRDDSLNVSPSSKSVASTIALIVQDYLNFRGHVGIDNSESAISTKCRYLGRVVSFIDYILLERPESCNPVLVNCLYGHGVIDSILNTFEATSQLLFAVNRPPASPMEMDEWDSRPVEKEETDNSWIYGALSSYGTLMDHLVTSSFVFSPSTKHLLTQHVSNGSIPFPQDAETFIKRLQSKVLKAVLPIWSHPHFTDCNYEFIAAIMSIIRHVYSGVEVKNVSNTRAQIVGPPPDETTISMIVEMGFSRPRAEEALRQVGTNSVEMAMEWLFSHPEEVQEDDELARALAMSLGSSSTTEREDVGVTINNNNEADEIVQLPPVDELLSTCSQLLQKKESLAFPVRDLLVLMSSRNDGECRPKVITHVIDNLKFCASDAVNEARLSAFFHVLALILHEDAFAREVAMQHGLVKITLDFLSKWNPALWKGENAQVPRWVTTAFLTIDRLLQVDLKIDTEILAAELLKKDNHNQAALIVDEKTNNLHNSLGFSSFINANEQKQLIEIACGCIHNQLPSETMHIVLQLCATLTKAHSNALRFLESGGLPSLLCLPASSLFSGFDNVAATIVHHILEDPQTLQQAMESEIRYSVATYRHSSGRLTPRSFLQNMASVMSRDPLIFMQAAKSVCEIEMVGERPHVVLLKDKEKEKGKEKDKQQATDGKTAPGDTCNGRLQDSNTKSMKVHRKFPQSFISTIELLLDYIMTFVPPPKDDDQTDGMPDVSSLADMEVDISKGKGKAIASTSQDNKQDDYGDSAPIAKTVLVLKLLTESLLIYASTIHVLLRRDAEVSNVKGIAQRGPLDNDIGGIFHHVLHKLLPYSGRYLKDKKADGDWRQKLVGRASQFLVASSIRSTEGRKRIFSEISAVFNDFVDSANGFRAPNYYIHSYIDLLNDTFATRSPTGSSILADTSATFVDAGLVQSLTQTLKVLDLDHTDSPKIVTGIVKVLELVTKEHIHSDINGAKASLKPSYDPDHSGRNDNDGDGFHSLETMSQPDHNDVGPENAERFSATQSSGSSDSGADAMDHDGDLDSGFARGTEDDFMRELSEDAGGLENGIATIGIRFEIPRDPGDNLIDEDNDDEDGEDDEEDEMSGDEGDEDEDDEEDENNDLEEDGVDGMSGRHLEEGEHEIDEDEFDEDGLEEEDDGDEDDEDGVILQLEEGINGIDVLDPIEVFGREYNFVNDTFRVMPVDIFGSRRQGRTTSIYNLIGRNGDNVAPPQHPLLIEPSSSQHSSPLRQSENAGEAGFLERNIENASSRLDGIFRALRSGRHGHRFNLWANDNHQRGSSNSPSIPPSVEELLISQLRRTAEQSGEQNVSVIQPQDNGETQQLQESVTTGAGENQLGDNTGNVGDASLLPNPVLMNATGNTDGQGDDQDGRDVSSTDTQALNMHCDRTDAAVRDVEAVSQESSGSGATLGESLRSLEVEIGSVDGHDDGERQGSTERPSGDLHPSRIRRGNNALLNNRETSLQSVSEVSPLPSQDQSHPTEEQQISRAVDSGSIDPAFLDALPEELRVEVLSSQQNQSTQLSNDQPQLAGDIDPEFLAALPPDIRAEVLAQQQAQRINHSHELEGQPVEMDTVSIIATFPSELREEVLLTSSDAILANLTPALVAEANMLRERYAHRYHSRGLLGMYPRSRRGESSRRGATDAAGNSASHKSMGGKLVEADGAPLVDKDALKSLIRLFRVVQPLYKGQFQKLLLNLCAHYETRTSLMQILMDMLMLDMCGPKNLNAAEPPYRLYSCQSYVIYSRPQTTNGIPPLVSRRVLETMTYLARNHPNVAKLLLHLELPRTPLQELSKPDLARGKSIMIIDEEETERMHQEKREYAILLLLSLLNQPLYSRSIAHLEQLLRLLDVIVDNAESVSNPSNKSDAAVEQTSDPERVMPDAAVEQTSDPERVMPDAPVNTECTVAPSGEAKSSKVDGEPGPSVSGGNSECDALAVLLSLPQSELRLLCSLLARDGLSDTAYDLVAEVLKKLVLIAPAHRHLFITELADSVQSLTKCALYELHGYMAVENAMNMASTDGTAILRVLQALSSLVTSLLEKDKDLQRLPDKEYNDAISQIWDINTTLEPLWLELSACIGKIESCSDSTSDSSESGSAASSSGTMTPVPAGSQNILPYIESFFVTCEKLRPGQSTSTHEFGMTSTEVEEASTLSSAQKISAGHSKTDDRHISFAKFSEKHRKLLNSFIRQNPGLLEKSLSLMLRVPRFIDFDNKRSYFRSKIKHQHDHHHSPLRISVRRAYILEDSYNQLRMRSTQELKGRLNVHFQGEEGIDAGGLTREWYQLLSRVIFDKGALLFTTVGNESTFQPNPNSVYQTEHLSYFKFVGRVVGKALFDGQLLDVHFTRSFYKHILGVKVTYHDIEAIEPGYYKNLKWMLENDITDLLDLTFSMDADEEKLILYERAQVTDHELIPGGRNIKVTEENKHEYVDLVAEYRLTSAIRPQINAFLEGFNELITRDLISIFNDKELELLISGLPDFDLDDLKANTEYSGYSAASPIIQWFWEVVRGFSKEDKARLLQFVTGTSKVPLEGFSALQGISGSQRFQIHKAYGSPNHLPSAHTCFNQLDLPEYPSKQQLQERLLLAIHEASEGFGFG